MADKVYLSNISAGWPFERQERVLAAHMALPGIYRDTITAAARKAKRVGDLKDRATLFRPSSRRQANTLYVASLACLAFDMPDFGSVLTGLAARQTSVVSLDDGLSLPPDPPAALIEQAILAFARAKKGVGLPRGREITAANRRANTLQRIELIRADWPKPDREFTTDELLRRAGEKPGKRMAPGTAKAHLGSRPAVQADYARELARETGRAAARTGKREAKA